LKFFLKICGNIRSSRCTASVVADTRGKFITSVIETRGKLPLVSLTPAENLTLAANLTPAANLPLVSMTLVANLQRGHKCFLKFMNRKSANSLAQFAFENSQISEICEFANFI
jgi:hypothetical protein